MTKDLNLNEKTIIIYGPIQQMVQSLATSLTGLGADVALIDSQASKMQRFAENLMDMRQVNGKNGRAAVIEKEVNSAQDAKDAVSRASELFGGVDVYIDANFSGRSEWFSKTAAIDRFEEIFHSHLSRSLFMAHAALEFLRGRTRGRVVFMLNDLKLLTQEGESLNAAARSSLINFSQSVAKEVVQDNVTINCLGVGVTEEYLLNRFPEAPTIKEAFEELKTKIPTAKMTDAIDVANAAAFFCSPLSSAVTGQYLSVSYAL